ncbi:GtrA family protein [Nitratireductor aquimarinus]|uniref:GtrA family protein n=1 Tax=Nitratireductor aquimarinus TaxID=889300 RepID=UPI001A903954|nr:GtrA family protein [Nitratireductor aquimarinus]MBY6130581.1 GtrA family protein [Nitratireductor aquimarinus]MCA1302663.1 GtrA family protein [Nitratireductor aquimarinus]
MRFLRFLAVGGTGFVVDAGLFAIALRLLEQPHASRALAIVGAITFTWAANRTLTFETGGKSKLAEYIHYFAVSMVGAAANFAAFSAVLWLTESTMISFVLGTCAGLLLNYTGYSRLVFARRSSQTRV